MRIVFGVALALAGALGMVASAGAHEHRALLDGQYEVSIGFIDEPAFVGEKNGLYLKVVRLSRSGAEGDEAHRSGEADDHAEGEPVLGLELALQAEVIFGDQRMALPLTPAFQQPGVYHSVFFPMAVGDYTFRIFGDLEGSPIDEIFTSAPDGFDSVQPREPFEFPKP